MVAYYINEIIDLNDIKKHKRNIKDSEWLLQKSYYKSRIDYGIYFLFLDDEIVYIGKSKSVYSRIRIHCRENKIPFNYFAIIGCHIGDINILENYYVYKTLPKYNNILNLNFLNQFFEKHNIKLES